MSDDAGGGRRGKTAVECILGDSIFNFSLLGALGTAG